MPPKVLFFPVDNGDMSLIELENEQTILIDTNIRKDADDPKDKTPNVIAMLKERLKRDKEGRLYVDVFLLSHPDEDHCLGISRHFHFGKPEDITEDKIFIHEIWSSPMIFRRAQKKEGWTMSADASVFQAEAKRRLKLFRANGYQVGGPGDRIKILGEDEGDKTADLESTAIMAKAGDQIIIVNEQQNHGMTARLLAPQHPSEVVEEEETLSKNNSSVIIQFSIGCRSTPNACLFLTGGDAEVAIWECLWKMYKDTGWFNYNLLQTPHHCSWHSLSYDSWKDCPDPEPSPTAISALSQALPGALIIASCKPIHDDDNDPPCIGAKRIYKNITDNVSGQFLCTGEYPSSSAPDLMEIEITQNGPLEPKKRKDIAPTIISTGAVGRQPLAHG